MSQIFGPHCIYSLFDSYSCRKSSYIVHKQIGQIRGDIGQVKSVVFKSVSVDIFQSSQHEK